MVLVAERVGQPLLHEALRSMFEARKRVFVDLLKWDVPVLQGRFELDQFDDEHAIYLIARGTAGEHLGSARLLPTLRPHILDTLFPTLCVGPPPRGPGVFEITRFCLERRLPAAGRLLVRNRLVSALADYALLHDITTYTAIAELRWLQQILAFGWACRPLGLPALYADKALGALRIEISPQTPALLAANCIYTACALERGEARAAA
jgi:acyl-homoserine lactone synthase